MKELAKELAPLVTSAMRNTKVDQRGTEKAFWSLKNNCHETAEQEREIKAEHLAFLVSKVCLIYI